MNRAGNRVLVVDDDVALTNRIAQILTREGYAALPTYGADEAERVARNKLPHIVITDFHMPGRTGLSLLASLRAHPATRDVPVILLTGESWETVGAEGHNRGLDVFLKKPLDVEALLSVVERQLSRAYAAENKLSSFRSHVTASIPHELRTPLSGVIGLGALLADHAETVARDPQQIRTFGKAVLASGERLQRLVESYLLYVQLEAGRSLSFESDGRSADPSEAIAATAKSLAASYDRENDLQLVVDSGSLEVGEDELPALTKIAEELIDNACKFSDRGTPVQVSLAADELRLSVRDFGRGMRPEQIAQIAPFVQFEREKYEQQGSGLGLSLSLRLAKAIGASLEIVSANEGGLIATLIRPRGQQ